MGIAKFAEELRNKTFVSVTASTEPVHSALAKSRSMPGRTPIRLFPEQASDKRRKALDKIAAKRQNQIEQGEKARLKRESDLNDRARRLLSTLQPKLVAENDKLKKQNERLLKHIKMLDDLFRAKSTEIEHIRRINIGS